MKVVSTYFFYSKIEQYKPMQLMELHKGKNLPLIPSEFWQRDAQKPIVFLATLYMATHK
jgi:hypothetical protein